MRESIAAIAVARREAGGGVGLDTFEYERTMEQMKSVTEFSEARERQTVAKHIEQFSAERRARGAPAAAAAPPVARVAAREGIDGWDTLDSEQDTVGLGLERGLERDADALFNPAASLVGRRAAVAAQIARDPAQMARGQRRGAAAHSKPRRSAGKPRQQSPPREEGEVLMVPKRLLADGEGEGSATPGLSPSPRKRLSPRKRGNPRKRLNQLKRLLKRLDEVSANASSK